MPLLIILFNHDSPQFINAVNVSISQQSMDEWDSLFQQIISTKKLIIIGKVWTIIFLRVFKMLQAKQIKCNETLSKK